MSNESLLKKIEMVLDQIRPNIQMDGGDIELVNYQDGVVYIRLHGSCIGCPASQYTLKLGVEETLKQHIAEICEVIAVE
jgi:Fe-S cluster biogenesis protein NfuA